MPTYTVHAVCKGTIRETWRVESATPLTDDALIEIVGESADVPEGVILHCLNEQTSDEEDRTVTGIEEADLDAAPRPVRVDPDPDVNWFNDAIQFPRLIVELEAAGAFTADVLAALRASMDLTDADIHNLLHRAQATWDDIKGRTIAPTNGGR